VEGGAGKRSKRTVPGTAGHPRFVARCQLGPEPAGSLAYVEFGLPGRVAGHMPLGGVLFH